ncbi:tripartite motif-containing protein 29 [Platysternon megacephalum]|uniref:Tripartite motif-containing protein 29 n=1 Tax=Platysternon megacephalum TaxID=55544 RepID=A0A4D9E4N3_9SAUR|nr:tripartite motif-containing protein 29 [Platysternon megacephalum]
MLQVVFIIRKEVASHSSPCCTYTAEDLYTHHTATQARALHGTGAVREPSSLGDVLVHPPGSLPCQWSYLWEGQTRSSLWAWRLTTVSPGWTLLLCVYMYVHTLTPVCLASCAKGLPRVCIPCLGPSVCQQQH